ncbi:MAG: HEAT repeat domain-containing protein [candidate division Zixibacteria bacterium]|nr:HEAT repeat domain-containing protein [candidate division Zixibacteria bacterium]
MKRRNMSYAYLISLLVVLVGWVAPVRSAGTELQKRFETLFVRATTGEIKYQNLVKPAKDSIAAMGAEAVPFLIDKCDTKSARERVAIIEMLKQIGRPAVPGLVKGLRRTNGLVVERVCMALAEIADSSSVPGLLTVTGHSRWQVREQAVGALGKCKDHRADSAVAAALVDTIGQVRKSAAVASGQLNLNPLVPQLVHLLADDFYGARMCALETLLGLDTANVIGAIADSMVSSNASIGDRACAVLGRFNTPRSREVLLMQTKSDRPARRAHAGVALISGDPLDSSGLQQLFVTPEKNPLVRLKLESAIVAGKSSTGK